jgi:phospholipase D1/2
LGIYFQNPKKIDVQDCVCDEFFNLFKAQSRQNTIAYDDVFKCLPSDNILNYESLSTYSSRPSLSKNNPVKGKEEMESKVSGFIVDFPLKFLSEEKNYFPNLNTPEGICPTSMWT